MQNVSVRNFGSRLGQHGRRHLGATLWDLSAEGLHLAKVFCWALDRESRGVGSLVGAGHGLSVFVELGLKVDLRARPNHRVFHRMEPRRRRNFVFQRESRQLLRGQSLGWRVIRLGDATSGSLTAVR